MIRSLLREFGYVLWTGIEAVIAFAKRHLEGDRPGMPDLANGILGTVCYQFLGVHERIEGYSKMIEQHAMLDANARQGALFYEFWIEKHVPEDHLLRSIDRFVDLSGIRSHLAPFYSSTGRPSVDPELMIRMLLVGYINGI